MIRQGLMPSPQGNPFRREWEKALPSADSVFEVFVCQLDAISVLEWRELYQHQPKLVPHLLRHVSSSELSSRLKDQLWQEVQASLSCPEVKDVFVDVFYSEFVQHYLHSTFHEALVPVLVRSRLPHPKWCLSVEVEERIRGEVWSQTTPQHLIDCFVRLAQNVYITNARGEEVEEIHMLQHWLPELQSSPTAFLEEWLLLSAQTPIAQKSLQRCPQWSEMWDLWRAEAERECLARSVRPITPHSVQDQKRKL